MVSESAVSTVLSGLALFSGSRLAPDQRADTEGGDSHSCSDRKQGTWADVLKEKRIPGPVQNHDRIERHVLRRRNLVQVLAIVDSAANIA